MINAMNRRAVIILMVLAVACGKEKIPLSGTATIDNRLYPVEPTPYIIGFRFSTASLVRNDRSPGPDITLLAETDAGGNITTITLNGPPAFNSRVFFRYGEYGSPDEARIAFDGLTEFDPEQLTWTELARPLAPNQVWLYRTGDDKYAKLMIADIETGLLDDRAYAECTFEWAFQPAGTTQFP